MSSTKGIYAAVSGAMAQSSRLDTIANNLANVNTTSFKKDRQIFSEYLTSYEKTEDLIRVPRIPASIESFYDMQGGDVAYANPAGTYTKWDQGALKATGSTLDVAIEGSGFMEVLTPQGLCYTRNGALKLNENGILVTKEGHPVLSAGDAEPEERMIELTSANVTISQNGEIIDSGRNIGRLALFDFANPDNLRKMGNSYYVPTGAGAAPLPGANGRFHQGFLELSNVNIIEEMTDMITANRVFETAQQAIKAHDQMDDKLINEAAKV